MGVSEPGVADSGDLEVDLPELLLLAAQAAQAAEVPVAILIDEVQYLAEEDLRALIVSVHRIGQRGLPLIVFGAGLPQLAALAGEAKSYAERLFDYPPVGALERGAAERAIREPIRGEGAEIEPAALATIVEQTQGYPYFLQEWGSHAWDTAPASPITAADVTRASEVALRALDRGFFRVRLDRLTPRERGYMRAMAELGPGPHRSGDIAALVGLSVTNAAPLRGGLIRKGMIYSPQHGETAFTVPMFDAFMARRCPIRRPRGGHARSESAAESEPPCYPRGVPARRCRRPAPRPPAPAPRGRPTHMDLRTAATFGACCLPHRTGCACLSGC